MLVRIQDTPSGAHRDIHRLGQCRRQAKRQASRDNLVFRASKEKGKVLNEDPLPVYPTVNSTSYPEKSIFVFHQGGGKILTGDIRQYCEDLNSAANTNMEPKDFR